MTAAIEARAGQWIWLTEENQRIVMDQGQAELYVVYEPRPGEIVRRFLREVKPGQLLAGLEPALSGHLKLLVLAVTTAKYRPIAETELLAGEVPQWQEQLQQIFGCRPERSGSLVSSSEALAVPELHEAMVDFCTCWDAYFQEQEQQAEDKLSDFILEKDLLVKNSYRELLRNLIPEIPFVHQRQDKRQPATVYALQEIAGYLGISRRKIKLEEAYQQLTDTREIIRLVTAAGGLFSREVTLPAGWQHMDQGPLLIELEGRAYAALPVSPHQYEYMDLDKGIRVPIDDSLVGKISSQAYLFYKGMPESIHNLKDWMKWSASLCWRSDFFVLIAACILAGIIPLVVPLVTQTIFADIIPIYDKQAHLMVIQVLLVTSVAGALIQLVRSITILRIKNCIHVTAESALWIKLLSLPAAFFRRFQIGDLTLRMQGINALTHQLSTVVAGSIFSGLFCFWNLLLMFYYSRRLALLAAIIWGIYLLVAGYFSWKARRYQRQKIEAQGRVSGQLLQLLRGLNKFKLHAAEARAFFLWTKKFGEEWKWARKFKVQSNWVDIINQSQPLLLNFCIFYLTMYLFDIEKEVKLEFLSQASFLSFNAAMGSFGSSVSGMLSGFMGLLGVLPNLERIEPILQETSEVTEGKAPAGQLTGRIQVREVDFRYKANLPLVLHNVSFDVEPGSFVAIAGGSGSGKSTLLRILLGMEMPENGTIQYDGQDLRQLDVTSVRRQIGVVMQNGRIMSGSVLSNIIGALPLSIEDAWEAARMVGLEEDIRDMPMGMHTLISEGGGNFSGGQQQRILIARSIINRPKTIVFDEATSALDNETQAIVSRSLEAMHATRIVVAHRLSTIRNADRILVMEKGTVVESGTYDELIAKKKAFWRLAKRQLL